jgi:chromosome condensin MukBEF ATPase and DNA-binding subunit MukB
MKHDPNDVALALSWRAEVESEIDDWEKTVPPLVLEREKAAADIQEAVDSHRRMQVLLLKRIETMSGWRYESPGASIGVRLERLRQKVDEAKSREAKARCAIEAARTKIKELRHDLAEFDRGIPVDETEEAAA